MLTEKEIDIYMIERFGAKTGNGYVRQALIDGYEMAIKQNNMIGLNYTHDQLKAIEYCAQIARMEEIEPMYAHILDTQFRLLDSELTKEFKERIKFAECWAFVVDKNQ
jgi:ABC-type Fe3+/spermidine/putrescine transport system ATPase subunit